MFESFIKKRLKNYKIQYKAVDSSLENQLKTPKSVAVIGSGLAGLSSATVLSERGFKVTVLEKNSYLGGKTGAWNHTFNDGYKATIDHGFHAFFYHYYNLWRFVEKIGIKNKMAPIEEYLVLSEGGERLSFKEIAKTPVSNILSLGKNGFFTYREMLLNPKSLEMTAFLNYDEAATFAKYDNQSFAAFSDRLRLNKKLRLVFNSFARAFFAEPEQMSMGELIKSFHFFYLSHDSGIDYDYLKGDYQKCLIDPTVSYLKKNGVQFSTNEEIEGFEKKGSQIEMNGNLYDYVVLAADVKGTKSIIQHSDCVKLENPQYYNQLVSLKHTNGYAVYKLWIKGVINEELPSFVITDRVKVLDAVTVFDAFDEEAKKWAQANNGTVLELHCYSVTPDMFDKATIQKQFLDELYRYFPNLVGKEITYDYLQLDNNFSSFQLNQHANRPSYKSPIKEMKIAGDWVKLPIPAMLMEAAYSSGLFAANEILKEENLQEETVYSVPLKGVLRGN